VFGDMLRIAMSSIMRRRSGVIGTVIAELLLLDYTNVQLLRQDVQLRRALPYR